MSSAVCLQMEAMRAEVEGRPFGLTLDETTNVGVQKQLVVYIKVKNKQHFVGLVTLKAGDAASFFHLRKRPSRRWVVVCTNVPCSVVMAHL